MPLLQIAEVFGHDTSTYMEESERKTKHCPFLGRACTKQGKINPLGICSYTDGTSATVVCPARFRERDRIIADAGFEAFGPGKRVLAAPEIRLLQLPGTDKRIGKIDYVIGLLSDTGDLIDFAALEVQAVYMSGKSNRGPFEHYLKTGGVTSEGKRRPDYRSSAQKRLMPQLALKVPVIRRLGKRFFVAVDSSFFAEMPTFRTVDQGTSEITWLVYPFEHQLNRFDIGRPVLYHTHWDDVLTALREGLGSTREELLSDIRSCRKSFTVDT